MANARETEVPLIEIRDLRIEGSSHVPGQRSTALTIVDGISLTLRKGQVLALIGESGAGKSTVGLSLLGHTRAGLRVSGGMTRLRGQDSNGLSVLRRLRGQNVTYVAQSAAAAFNPALKLIDQVVEATVRHGLSSRVEAERRAVALFRDLALPEPESIGDRYPHQVSGGQLQRIMIAMALCPSPDLVVFDEPTTALDVTTQMEVLLSMRKVIRGTGVAALYISHDLAVVAQVADEVMVLRHGRQVEFGATTELIERPREDYTRALVSAQTLPHAEKPAAGPPLLAVEGVSAAYGMVRVLDDVSAAVASGQTLALVGESGSGKSTLARVVTGLLPPTAGRVAFDGRVLPARLADRTKEDLRSIQIVHQMADVAMNPRQTVRDIVGRPLTLFFGLRGAARDKRVYDLLDALEVSPALAERYPAELSGGQKQRVCIARALAAKPKLIVCDEVTSALDPLVAHGLLALLLRLQEAEGVAYLFITHDIATVRSIADEVAVMRLGRIVRAGTRTRVLSPPFDDYTDRLLRSVPTLDPSWLEHAAAIR